jgi:hypothetical protein
MKLQEYFEEYFFSSILSSRNGAGHSALLSAMPRYFFDSDNTTDTTGVEFPNDAAAKQEATLRAMNGTGHQLEHYRGADAITLRNADGDEIFKARIRRR